MRAWRPMYTNGIGLVVRGVRLAGLGSYIFSALP